MFSGVGKGFFAYVSDVGCTKGVEVPETRLDNLICLVGEWA